MLKSKFNQLFGVADVLVSKKTHYVSLFEQQLETNFCQAVGVSSGSSALYIALRILGLNEGDGVIMSAYGCPAIASAARCIGAEIQFVDTNKQFGLAFPEVKEAIRENTKGIILVNYFGQLEPNIVELKHLAWENNLFLLEDATQVFGAVYDISGEKRYAGTIGDLGCFSYSTGKPFETVGTAGVLVSQRQDHIVRAKALRSYGSEKRNGSYEEPSLNMKMNETQAAILHYKLKVFDKSVAAKRVLSKRYDFRLSKYQLERSPVRDDQPQHYYYIKTLRRDLLLRKLTQQFDGRQYLHPIVPYPKLISDLNMFQGSRMSSVFPTARELSDQVLLLPLHEDMSLPDVNKTCDIIGDYMKLA